MTARAAHVPAALAAALVAVGAAGCGKDAPKVRRDRDAGPPVAASAGAHGGGGGRAAAGDEREPNDAPDQATPLPVDHFVRGTLDGETDVDLYRIAVDRPGQLRVTVGGIEGVDLKLELRDAAGEVLARSDRGPAGTVEGFPGFGVTRGDYVVAVAEYVKPRPKKKAKKAKGKKGAEPVDAAPEGRVGPSPTYELAVALVDAPPLHELEPNDDAGTAVEVLLADTVRGYVGWSGDVDLWKMALEGVAAQYCLDVEVTGVDGLVLAVEILDAGGEPLVARKGVKGGGVAIECLVPVVGGAAPPWHFVRVGADRSNPEATYELRFTARLREDDEEAEPNDDVARASALGAEDATSGTVRATYALGDVDRFVLPPQREPMLLDVTVEPPAGVDLALDVARAAAPGAAIATANLGRAGDRERLAGVAIPTGEPIVVTVQLAGKPGKDDGGDARPYRVSWSIAPAGDLPMPPEEPGPAAAGEPLE